MLRKFIGVIFIIVGTGLALWGYDVYDSATSQFTRAIDGETPLEAWAGMIGGAICIVIGMFTVK